MRKQRIPIPDEAAAEVLFLSDRMCCVCHERGSSLQVHHIDEDPSNNDIGNLAVLCLECHAKTQTKGGFGRKLDQHQILAYRENWYKRIKNIRDMADLISSMKSAGAESKLESVIRMFFSHAEFDPPQLESWFRGSRHGIFGKATGAPVMQTDSDMISYINSLPEIRQKVYEEVRPRWDSGVTSEMLQASYDLIHILEQMLVRLASRYPEDHFGNQGAANYMNSVIASRFEWHRAHMEPDGAGTGGTIVGEMASGYVISDVEDMIGHMVFSLTVLQMLEFDYDQWEARWKSSLHSS